MTPSDRPPTDTPPEPAPRLGLRLRLYLGCLLGVALAIAGAVLVLSRPVPGPANAVAGAPFGTLVVIFALGLIASVVAAVWLDRGIVRRLRNLSSSTLDLHRGDLQGAGWGELSDLTALVQAIGSRHRQLARAGDDLDRLERTIALTREAVERWIVSERWEPLSTERGPLMPLVIALNRGFDRERDVTEQNQQATVEVRAEATASLEDAREAAEQAEHGFVEATALLTTVRELQRLMGELQQKATSSRPVNSESSAAHEEWRAAAASAIEELVASAGESVDHLAAGLMSVHEIAEQVHVLANRATLIALNAVLSGGRGDRALAPAESPANELKLLARDVRAATERIAELSRQVEADVASASERMHGIRERVIERLEQAPPVSAEVSPTSEELSRLLERMREMVQDAMRKGERLSAAGERASRSAEGVVLRLEDHLRDLEGLVVRLTPTDEAENAGASQRPNAPSAIESDARAKSLRLLGRSESDPGDAPETRGREERS